MPTLPFALEGPCWSVDTGADGELVRRWHRSVVARAEVACILDPVYGTWDNFEHADGYQLWQRTARRLGATTSASAVDRAWAERYAAEDAQRARRTVREQAARREACKLLELVLTQEQLTSWNADGAFDVRGSGGGTYRVQAGSVTRLEAGEPVEALCAHPAELGYSDADGWSPLPTEDVAVAQVLALTCDEEAFLSVANVSAVAANDDVAGCAYVD